MFHTHHHAPHLLAPTQRDFFFADPHFSSTWDDFDTLRKAMQQESRQFWRNEEHHQRRLEQEQQQQQLQHQKEEHQQHKIQKKEEKLQQKLQKKEDKMEVANGDDPASGDVARAEDFGPSFAPWFFPRRWLLPKLLGGESDLMDQKMRNLDLFQYHGDDHVIRLKDDNDKFEVSLDTHGYKPEELKVKVENGKLTVEGRHEVQGEHKYVCRKFSRSYSIPPECDPVAMKSDLSSDGVLVVTAPKKAIDDGHKAVPIELVKHK